jgi:cell division protein FtsB
MARYWIVPSSLFVPGHIMAPERLKREKEAMQRRKAKLEAELAALPAKIEATQAEIDKLGEEYQPFVPMERS